jgi:DNA-binding NtrC family response regulator
VHFARDTVSRVGAPKVVPDILDAAPELDATSFGTTLGASEPMRRLYPLCARLARSDVPVVIEGETGTGKEELAQSLHRMGPRRNGPFVVFDCTAVAPTLIEAELFGHQKGAFTGATSPRAGVFEQASGGTIFIDEIGDLPIHLQPKLLRAIERHEVMRVGSSRSIVTDVRVVAATRRNLEHEVQRGLFRDDLFHRVAVVRIELPPLRDRRGDVPLLARHFCRELTGRDDALPDQIVRRWEDYAWPGNVRELRNAVARQVALGDLAGDVGVTAPASRPRPTFSGEDVTSVVLALNLPFAEAREHILVDFERRYLDHVLALHGGNITCAAAAAGIGRRYFYKLAAKHTSADDAAFLTATRERAGKW